MITCHLTSDAICANPEDTNSNEVTVVVYPLPSVQLVLSENAICENDSIHVFLDFSGEPNFEYDFVLSRASDTWRGKKGYVQHFLKETNYKEIPTTFYLCGNGGMIKEAKHQLLEVDGLDKTRVWAEAFD